MIKLITTVLVSAALVLSASALDNTLDTPHHPIKKSAAKLKVGLNAKSISPTPVPTNRVYKLTVNAEPLNFANLTSTNNANSAVWKSIQNISGYSARVGYLNTLFATNGINVNNYAMMYITIMSGYSATNDLLAFADSATVANLPIEVATLQKMNIYSELGMVNEYSNTATAYLNTNPERISLKIVQRYAIFLTNQGAPAKDISDFCKSNLGNSRTVEDVTVRALFKKVNPAFYPPAVYKAWLLKVISSVVVTPDTADTIGFLRSQYDVLPPTF